LKVLDEVAWQEQQQEIRESGEVGEKFLEYFKFWIDATEALIQQDNFPFSECLNTGLIETIVNLGDVPSWALGQMLALLSSHWEYRDELADNLSPIEMQLLLESLQLQISKNQEFAELAEEESSDASTIQP